ncbi:hypothetical protein F5J12DRAFT_893276 [Pisolithus orientalis]|uniref:uncharacterized protein n=1 Tax=Pisolithus orientalis TaxID=936130 RepID=UPI0022240AB0|nr:uncharacterized protein F5J12DRAFT_893276 [Pisolithus orientalis]KAI6005203.1 hypothetical protein F5J12DRAFT_893276 [Pisolithus orientalis]
MPHTTERQKAEEALLDVYLATLLAESHSYLDPPTSSDSNSSGSESARSESSDEHLYGASSASSAVLNALPGLYLQHYLANCQPIKKTSANLELLLGNWKFNHPEIFRSHLGVTPACFDLLVKALQEDPVFHNQSTSEQMTVQDQVAIALYCFQCYGNGATTVKVALWAGIGYGTVCLVTNCVMMVVCSERFWRSALHWPDDDMKEKAKAWVEEHSCPA